MDTNSKLMLDQGESLSDMSRYQRLVGKLNSLTMTRPVVSQFLKSPCDNKWNAVVHILRYIKGSSGR